MPTNSPVLAMPLPNGGPPGVGDPISRANLNSFFLTVEDLLRIVECTSLTRPSSPFPRQMIYETDTKIIQYRNNANNAWVRYNGVPIVNNPTTDVTLPTNGQLAWSFTGFGLMVWKSSTSTWTPLTHDQYFTFRLGTNTSVSPTWTPIPFATAGEGSNAGISTSDNITWTLNEPGIWTVDAYLAHASSVTMSAALIRGTGNDPFAGTNITEVYSMASGSNVLTGVCLSMSADIRVATAGSRTVKVAASVASGSAPLVNNGPLRPRISFRWSPL